MPAAPVWVALAEAAFELEVEVELPVVVVFRVAEVPLAVDAAPLAVDAAPLEVAVAPMGAVDWPLISAWMVELKVPVMPAIVNLAEKASAGNWELVASFRAIDVKRTKYSLPSGPMVPSGVKTTDEVVETSTLLERVCSNVC